MKLVHFILYLLTKIHWSIQSDTTQKVSEQYQDYPYPAYEREEEIADKEHFVLHTDCFRGLCNPVPRNTSVLKYYMFTIALSPLNHYLYKGKEDFKTNFRILLPGGGTGNSVVNLGEQLNHTNAEIVYLDFSKSSLNIAQNRAKMQGLTNISWLYDTIENIPNLNLGKFDLIECSGVLHHLEDPDAGLRILSDSLSDRGGLDLMVYARIGRTGVYQLQDLVRLVNEGVITRKEELRNVWKIFQSIDPESLRRKVDFRLEGGPIKRYNRSSYDDRVDDSWDTESYDKYCHKQDRSYTARELFDFIEAAGLNFVSVNGPRERFVLSVENNEDIAGLDKDIKRHLRRLSVKEKMGIAELIDGAVDNHNIYASKKVDTEASFEDVKNIPYIYGAPKNLDVFVGAAFQKNKGGDNRKYELSFRYATSSPRGEWGLSWRVSQVEKRMVELIKPGTKTIEEILNDISSETHVSKDKVFKQCNEFYQDAKKADIILLKSSNINPFPKTNNLTFFALGAK